MFNNLFIKITDLFFLLLFSSQLYYIVTISFHVKNLEKSNIQFPGNKSHYSIAPAFSEKSRVTMYSAKEAIIKSHNKC